MESRYLLSQLIMAHLERHYVIYNILACVRGVQAAVVGHAPSWLIDISDDPTMDGEEVDFPDPTLSVEHVSCTSMVATFPVGMPKHLHSKLMEHEIRVAVVLYKTTGQDHSHPLYQRV
nr:hypothetical protein [Tanacetum cinerariifolium]